MKYRIIALLAAISAVLGIAVYASDASDSTEIKESDYQLIWTDDPEEIAELIEEAEGRQETAHALAEAARKLGCAEDSPIIKWASKEWWKAFYCLKEYNKWLSDVVEENVQMDAADVFEEDTGLKYTTPEQWEEYPVAAEVYEYLRGEMDLSPAVASGILGGMCQECGACSLSLQWWLSARGFRGLHMWHTGYCPEMATANLQQQLAYLKETLDKNIRFFGGNPEYMRAMTDPGAVCSYMYTWYGRGGGLPTQSRLNCAYMVYDYFGGA